MSEKIKKYETYLSLPATIILAEGHVCLNACGLSSFELEVAS